MIDRAIGGRVPKVQDYLFINRAVESLVRCGKYCTFYYMTDIGKVEPL